MPEQDIHLKVVLACIWGDTKGDACGRTTLSVVVLEGLVKMTKVLLCTPSARNSKSTASKTNGANPLVADDEGRCPLHIAAWQGQIDLVYLLLQVTTPTTFRCEL
ncbi:unnamed protein product [Mesocestoides corti]|uniref:ANK_REP_REGION domain-containing protein n=1 Tax=Mesocestoides corti TaxID=53468 RepID=A0A0R3U7T0_MESCO|nr:unnamed protein product [Mesocestoides corti]